MSRSKWKPLYKNNELLNSIKNVRDKNVIIKTFVRNMEITKDLIGYTFSIYTGNSFKQVLIKSSMVGHKLGEFVPTRRKPVFKKKK